MFFPLGGAKLSKCLALESMHMFFPFGGAKLSKSLALEIMN